MVSQMQKNSELLRIRDEIDRIDSELIPLFVERMKCSEDVARIKIAEGLQVLDKEREKKVLEKVRGKAGEYGDSATILYASMMSLSRAHQYQLIKGGDEIEVMEETAERSIMSKGAILCQGAEGAYSHKAALRFLKDIGGNPDMVDFKSTWTEVFELVDNGSAEFGVLPVENSSAGSVHDVYSLILRYRLYIIGAVSMRISHCLASKDNGKITKVISHPQALAQCSSFILKNGFAAEEFSNTAAAAKYLMQNGKDGEAVICSEEAAKEYGLKIVETDIQDMKYNMTRFVILSKRPILPEDANKIGLCFSLPHTSGSLYSILEMFAVNGLNLTKIESRPIPGSRFDYSFYLDFTGNIHDVRTKDLIGMLQQELPGFSFLGNYKEIEG